MKYLSTDLKKLLYLSANLLPFMLIIFSHTYQLYCTYVYLLCSCGLLLILSQL